MTQLLKMISTNEITMLKDINNLINIDKKGKFTYCYIPNMERMGIINFLAKLENDSYYTIIPIITMSAKDNDAHIILSKQILVSNYSNSKLIHDYLNTKLDQAICDFGCTNLDNNSYYLIFKYKKVTLDFSKLA
jgi:hypothetical protein